VAVIRIPHISNFTDFDPLQGDPGPYRSLRGNPSGSIPLCRRDPARIEKHPIRPGEWLKTSGWQSRIADFNAGGGHITGICGGYQMMGNLRPRSRRSGRRTGRRPPAWVCCRWKPCSRHPRPRPSAAFPGTVRPGTGYEIHMGHGPGCTRRKSPADDRGERNGNLLNDTDGCMRLKTEQTIGTYMHGLFDTPALITRWLSTVGIIGIDVPADRRSGG
jgi:adenosylcobyric acid synthase